MEEVTDHNQDTMNDHMMPTVHHIHNDVTVLHHQRTIEITTHQEEVIIKVEDHIHDGP
jgi:hypothetical protein